jgi:hypothetical protein
MANTASIREIAPNTFPEVNSGFFDNAQEGSDFWIGKVASDGTILRPDCYNQLLQFRGNIYVHELGYLPPDSVDKQGRETDADDERSILLGAVEKPEGASKDNGSRDETNPRVIGSARLVLKKEENNPLPIEEHFSEYFDNPIQPGISSEVSRYISRHPDTTQRHAIALALVRAMTYRCVENGIQDAYAVLEKKLHDMLNFVGVDSEQLGESKYIDELNGELYPVVFKPFQVIEDVSSREEKFTLLRGFFKGETGRDISQAGEGFYPRSLMRQE